MKKILLLGGFGFIGTNLLKYIDAHFSGQYSVVVFDKFPKHTYNITFQCVEKVYAGDFSDTLLLKTVFQQHTFDLVIHSLSTTVPTSSNNVRFDIESNLIPTVELLNLMVEFAVKDIVYISSGGAIYGMNNSNKKHKETDDTFPLSSYGVVKLAIEKYLFQYASLYQIRPLVLRLSNPYGKYHYSTKQGICNVALRAAIKNEPFNVWGTGDARKDYIYIDDFCNILFQLYNKSIYNKVLNVGSGCVLSLNQILEEIKILVPSFGWEYTDASKYDVSHFELDSHELHSIVGKCDFVSFQDGMEKTMNWLNENIEI